MPMVDAAGEARSGCWLTLQGQENALRDALAEAAPIYRKDPGTLGWHVLSGKKEAKGSFVAVERYADANAIKTHASNPVSDSSLIGPALLWTSKVVPVPLLTSQHFKVFGKKVAPLCAKQTELTYYDEVEDSAKL